MQTSINITSMNIALCFSGHLRNFDKCISNIKQNIIVPLSEISNIDTFLSTWNTKNCRVEKTEIDLSLVKSELTPVQIEVEEPKLFNTNSTDFLNYPKYSSPDTCSNAISMWYKAYKSYRLLEQYAINNNKNYDVVIRIRPDATYHQKIDLDLIFESITNNSVYMPIWHGKYEPVTRQMMDQFAFGSTSVMKIYFSVFENINNLLNRAGAVHTGEGLLFEQIKDLNIKRFEFHYDLVRDNSIDNIV